MIKTQNKKYPYRTLGVVLIAIAIILGVVGFALTFTSNDPFAAGMVAWIPGILSLWGGIVFLRWDGKNSDGGHTGPL